MHSIRCPKIITWIRNFQKSAQRQLVKLADAQADISLRCTHNLEGIFPHVGIQYLYVKMSCKGKRQERAMLLSSFFISMQCGRLNLS